MCAKCHGNLSNSGQDKEPKMSTCLRRYRRSRQKPQSQLYLSSGGHECVRRNSDVIKARRHLILDLWRITGRPTPTFSAGLSHNWQPYTVDWVTSGQMKISPLLADDIGKKYSLHFSVTAVPVPSSPKPLISLRRPSRAPGVSLGLKVRQVVVCSRKPFSRACWHLAMTHKHSCAPVRHICRLLSLGGKIGATQGGGHLFFFIHTQSRGGKKRRRHVHACE